MMHIAVAANAIAAQYCGTSRLLVLGRAHYICSGTINAVTLRKQMYTETLIIWEAISSIIMEGFGSAVKYRGMHQAQAYSLMQHVQYYAKPLVCPFETDLSIYKEPAVFSTQ